MLIKSGINDNNFKGILDGPVDIFSSETIISRISSLDIWTLKFDYDFLKIKYPLMFRIIDIDSKIFSILFFRFFI